VLWRNVGILDQAGCDYSFQATITRENTPRMPEIVRYFCKMGKPKVIKLEPVSPAGRFCGHAQEVPNDELFAEFFDQAYGIACGHGVRMDCAPTRLTGSAQSTFCGTCQAPFFITPDGMVSACYEACWAETKHADRLIIGRYDADARDFIIDHSRLELLRSRNVNNLEHCRNCFCKYACAGDCLARNLRVLESADILVSGARCELIRMMGRRHLRRVLDEAAVNKESCNSMISPNPKNQTPKEKTYA
jgi:uncharacterized protein